MILVRMPQGCLCKSNTVFGAKYRLTEAFSGGARGKLSNYGRFSPRPPPFFQCRVTPTSSHCAMVQVRSVRRPRDISMLWL